jgi:hypothetical protein
MNLSIGSQAQNSQKKKSKEIITASSPKGTSYAKGKMCANLDQNVSEGLIGLLIRGTAATKTATSIVIVAMVSACP